MSATSWPPEESQVTDPFVAVFTSPSRSRSMIHSSTNPTSPHSLNFPESAPLGEPPAAHSSLTRFLEARAIRNLHRPLLSSRLTRSIQRGMTLAPRIEVFTQLSCTRLHHSYNHTTWIEAASSRTSLATETGDDDPRELPSARCMSDPAVQAGAARIQTMFTTTMGLLSALTTGWWGRFGERHGRTRVLAFTTLGLLLTDLTFILASTPSSPLSSHGHKLLLIAPAYRSGSRASMFSRFTGFGPILGGWLIRNPIPFLTGPPHPGQPQAQTVTSAFWVAIALQFINLCLVLFVFPESVTQEQRDLARGKNKGKAPDRSSGNGTLDAVAEEPVAKSGGIIRDFLSPLAIFLPVPILVDGTRKRQDWSLTLLACAMFGYMLSTGLYQIKYLYASHVYGWGPEQLSYYISLLGTTRAAFLLFALPFIITTFKPKPKLPKTKVVVPTTKANKPKPTKSHIAQEIKFDLGLSRLSLCIDIVANLSIVFAPAPSYKMHLQALNGLDATATTAKSEFQNSQVLFVLASWAQCMGAGVVPAMQSLALCIVQARSLLAADAGAVGSTADAATGTLFGALAVLQASGQMVLGPLLFGLVYSGTVATFPKTVFVVAIGILFAALTAIMLVRSPLSEVGKAPARRRLRRSLEEEERRGRSTVSKDLGYGSTSQASSSGSS
ncbi:hypothetical protein C8R46DRAFT_1165058 [Mycena filopes]|nr:hypothetical protein C8R46DRAFT_1165058 [Mycena filopes]